MTIYKINHKQPSIDSSAFIAPEATVIGDVHIGKSCSVWAGAVIRADNDRVVIGDETNIQEGAVLHVDAGKPINIGKGVSIGHQAMLHGCTVGDGSLIGIKAVILDNAKIGKNCLVGAGALVTEGKEFPDGSLIIGSPAKALKTVTPEQLKAIADNAALYAKHAAEYLAHLEKA